MYLPLSIAAFTNGKHVPSTRFRLENLQQGFQQQGISLTMFHAQRSAYPPARRSSRPLWFARELVARIPQIIRSYSYDAVILQRELIATLPTLEPFTKWPRILDVDDAIWMFRNGWGARVIANHADHIVCGNDFLADYFARFHKPVSVIPTTVDTRRFLPHSHPENKIIGWSGSSSGLSFLRSIEEPLGKVLADNPGWRLRVVSDQRPDLSMIPKDRVEYVRWKASGEVQAIAETDIGIMPLDDNLWSRGKCAYKMLLYMACSLPVVVSDIGMNHEILQQNFVGYGVRTPGQWHEALNSLIHDPQLRHNAGQNGRRVVEASFSVDQAVTRWVEVLGKVL
jgi:glycosyltransferase involved in cell wall biosynthesis